MFPIVRPRRLREYEKFRHMLSENHLKTNDFVYPLFVAEGKNIKKPISSMPGIYQLCIENLLKEVEEIIKLDIPAVLLFGIPLEKDSLGSQAYADNGIVQEAVKAIKNRFNNEIAVITDVCLCEFTSHGHCGIVENNTVVNDKTLKLLAQTALSHAKAGADMVAPSDMMDGRVAAIRQTLDDNNYTNIPIMSYSAKYASAFYGPFREAAESAPQFGDRKGYQMDCANSDEAIRETLLDIKEGADIVMVKPALSYLDIIKKIKDEFSYPVAAYNVSGEYSMVKAASNKGWIDEDKIVDEMLLSMKRAGSDIIITYFAKDVAKRLKQRNGR